MTAIRTLGYLTLDAPPLETIDAAAAAGFESVGIRITGRRMHDPYTSVIGEPSTIAQIRKRVADRGIRLSNVSAYHLWPDVGIDPLYRVVDTTLELGAKILVANSYDPDEQSFIDRVGRMCERGAKDGLRIAIEFMRYSAVRSIADCTRIIDQVGAPNLGYLLDALHLARSGGTADAVRSVDPAHVIFAQLCDAKRAPRFVEEDLAGGGSAPSKDAEDFLRVEARTGRLYPDDGVLPLRDFIAALPPGTEIEYEVPRRDLKELTLAERAKVAHSVFYTWLDAPRPGK